MLQRLSAAAVTQRRRHELVGQSRRQRVQALPMTSRAVHNVSWRPRVGPAGRVGLTVKDGRDELHVVHVAVGDYVDIVVVENLLERLLAGGARLGSCVVRAMTSGDDPSCASCQSRLFRNTDWQSRLTGL